METSSPSHDHTTVRTQMLKECAAMAKYALASGSRVPGNLIQTLEEAGKDPDRTKTPELKTLARTHERLARIVAPSTPRTILLLAIEADKQNIFKFLGRVPLVRRLMLAAVFFLTSFVAISLSPEVNETGGDILKGSGESLLLNQLFFLSAAGLGAAFAALFQANRYVVEGTFDPKYESSYWIRFTLGIIAGLLLAVLIPIDTGDTTALGKPLLAMLGGFSAALVHRILNRLVETVESLVRGSTKEMVNAQVRTAKARAEEQYMGSRLRMANGLMEIKHKLGVEGDPEEVRRKLDKLLGDLVPAGSENDSPEPGPESEAQ